MVAIIKTSSNLRNVLQYNENKLKQNVAKLIHSTNFGKDTNQLGFTDKLKTIEKLISLNQRSKLNTTHISLNFDPSEKLSKETLQKIADSYMQRIGFADQPYLVYEHRDAGHPHLHIVSTNIQRDGKAIKMFNIGRNQSETARKEIEKEFGLVKAEKEQKIAYELKPLNVQKVQYGKSETKRAITNVLNAVLPVYKYASLPELNAVLKQYNVTADRGSEDSRTYKNNGLVYRVLDEKGIRTGTPIKASAIYNYPGLLYLNQQFEKNQSLKNPYKTRVKNVIDFHFLRNSKTSIKALQKTLVKENINIVLRQNDKGIIYGITYVDHQQKCVFNGSDLGKEYSANRIQERCVEQILKQGSDLKQSLKVNQSQTNHTHDELSEHKIAPSLIQKDTIKGLIKVEQESSLAAELRNEELRKRKRKLRH